MPIRIQRKRTKGWKAPEGAVYVGRPSIFGNPFSVKICGLEAALNGYRDALEFGFNPKTFAHLSDDDFHLMYVAFNGWSRTHHNFRFEVSSLRGKDLMCWCPLSSSCHADILLEIANR